VLDGPGSAVAAALGALTHEGRLGFEGGQLSVAGELPADAHPLERTLHGAVAARVTKLEELRRAAQEEIQRLEEGLRGQGLLMEREQSARYKLPRLLFVAALVPGVAKLVVGVTRDRPVLFLVLVLLGAGFVGWRSLARAPRRTRRGDKALKLLREEHESLLMTASSGGTLPAMSGSLMALGVGLYGLDMLEHTGVEGLRGYVAPVGNGGGDAGCGGGDSDCGGGDSSCGGDSGGGDGGGCGGCGGGD
jgi:uncharacterized protein (TIGR04222 family)